MKKDDLEFYLLIPTLDGPRIQYNEFVLVASKGKLRKPVLLTIPRNRFERKLTYYKKFSLN